MKTGPRTSASLEAGQAVTPAIAAALANFGVTQPVVHRQLVVGVLVTGNELLPPDAAPEPWQLRDSNAETLRALLQPIPWVTLCEVQRVPDEPARCAMR